MYFVYEIYQRILLRVEDVFLEIPVWFDWKYAYGRSEQPLDYDIADAL